jgi:hypothetical protein
MDGSALNLQVDAIDRNKTGKFLREVPRFENDLATHQPARPPKRLNDRITRSRLSVLLLAKSARVSGNNKARPRKNVGGLANQFGAQSDAKPVPTFADRALVTL